MTLLSEIATPRGVLLNASLDEARAADANESDILAALKTQARGGVVARADAVTRRITARYPAAEVASWPTQEREARAIKAGAADATQAPLVATLAAAFGMELDAMADAVLAKADGYRAVVAAVIKARDDAMTAIEAAASLPALAAAVEQGRAAADALSTRFGL